MPIELEDLKDRLTYDPDTGLLHWREGHHLAGREAFTYTSTRGYKTTNLTVRGSKLGITAHRAAWALHHDRMPNGQIDHINGDRLDNRIVNLREVTNAENAKNSCIGSKNTSGVLGVYRHSQTGKWTAQINAFGKTIGLGCFSEFSDAVIARKAAERVLGYHPNHGRKPK